jgi:branched-chain amino acid transport system substrate-binding protein
MNRRYWLLSLAVCALGTQMAPSWAADPEVVKIGFVGPLSGGPCR